MLVFWEFFCLLSTRWLKAKQTALLGKQLLQRHKESLTIGCVFFPCPASSMAPKTVDSSITHTGQLSGTTTSTASPDISDKTIKALTMKLQRPILS